MDCYVRTPLIPTPASHVMLQTVTAHSNPRYRSLYFWFPLLLILARRGDIHNFATRLLLLLVMLFSTYFSSIWPCNRHKKTSMAALKAEGTSNCGWQKAFSQLITPILARLYIERSLNTSRWKKPTIAVTENCFIFFLTVKTVLFTSAENWGKGYNS